MNNNKIIPSTLKVTASDDLDLLLEQQTGEPSDQKSIAKLLHEQEKTVSEQQEEDEDQDTERHQKEN